MRTFTVDYTNEMGEQVGHAFTDEDVAIGMYELMETILTGDEDHAGFPMADAWDFLGWFTETVGDFGYVTTGYSPHVGNWVLSIGYREETPISDPRTWV